MVKKMNNDEENTDYDLGYFQAIKDISMMFLTLGAYYNAKDLQKIIKDIKQQVYDKVSYTP